VIPALTRQALTANPWSFFGPVSTQCLAAAIIAGSLGAQRSLAARGVDGDVAAIAAIFLGIAVYLSAIVVGVTMGATIARQARDIVLVRAIGAPVIDALGARSPTAVLRAADPGHYARVLHRSLEGEWDYDLDLKHSPGPPIRVGWLRAVVQGQRRVAGGLGIEVPVLVLASARTSFARRWSEDLRGVDSVLDVEQIAARAVRLGRCVTVVRIEDGLHDLVLSAPGVRERVSAEMRRWAHGYL
jgi:alpha-beta hydrolase superfamily lysophospholipase